MAGHDVFFDIVENDRIGFAVSDCSYPRLINNTPSADQNDVSSTSSSTISPTNSPKPDTPTTSKVGIGKYFPVEKKMTGMRAIPSPAGINKCCSLLERR